jgi:hypothetical protein
MLARSEPQLPRIRRGIPQRRSRSADWARLAGALAVPVLVLDALGARIGTIPEMALVPALACGFLLAVLALILAVYALIDIWASGADGARSAIAGLIYASPALALLGLVAGASIVYPRLADVTTDVADPPMFSIAAAPPDRPDSETSALQRAAYPKLAPRVYSLPIGDVYRAALELVEKRGWEILRDTRPAMLEEEPPAPTPPPVEDEELSRALALKRTVTQSRAEVGGTPPSDAELAPEVPPDSIVIEATAKTLLFGFRDDVVIRLKRTPEGAKVDMRSASRIGEHDLGQNKRRIEAFLVALDAILQPPPEGAASGVFGQ